MISRVKPLVVFESAFPGSLDPRDRDSYQGGLYFNEGFGNTSGSSLYRTSQYQNKYLGYYKIIPLNVVSISTSASKEGNSFTVELLPDYVYVLYDKIEYLPKEIRDTIGEKNLDSNLTLMSYLDSFLLGTYTSATTLQSALLPRINLASVLSPMDTVSIYIARIPEYISDSLESIFFGQNPGRIKEIDLIKITKGRTVKYLYEAGINISDLFKLLDRPASLYEKLYVFKKYSPNFLIAQVGLGREGTLGTLVVRVYGNNDYRKSVWEQEKKLFQSFPNSITEVQQLIGSILARKYVFAIRSSDNSNQRNKIINDIISNIDSYYKSNQISQFISWSAYQTMLSIFAQMFGENYVNYKSPSFRDIVIPIIKSLVIENLFKDAYPNVLYSYEDLEVKNAAKKLSDYLSNLGIRDVFGKNSPDNIYTVYIEGVNTLFKLVINSVKFIKNSGLLDDNIKAREFIDEKVEGITFKANQSGDGLALVLRGHITSISENFSLALGSASKSFRISGKGFEHPLETHEIFFDKVSIKLVSQPVENFSVAISDPISAAKRILKNFAPERIVGKDLDADTLNVKIIQDRGFDAFVKVKGRYGDSPTRYPYIIHGNTLAPSYLADYSDLKIFTPIHYVSTNLMSSLESEYKNLTNAQGLFFGINRNLPDRSSVLRAIKDAVSYNSLYRVFVNQFGELNLTFDISSISIPFSLSIIPPITDESFISGELSVDERNVSTMVEIVPTSFSVTAPSSPSLPIFYGRSTAEALYDLAEVYEIKTFDNSKDEGFLKFLDAATSKIGENVFRAIKRRISELEKKKRTSEEESLLQSLKTIDSIVNKTPRNKINSFLKGETVTVQKEIKTSIPVTKETTENTIIIDTCFGERETIVQKGTQVEIKEEVRKVQQTESVYLFESNPELEKIYILAREFFVDYFSPISNISFYSPVSLRYEILNVSVSDLCAGINDYASKYLGVNEVCFRENIDALLTFMAVGIKFPGREYKNNTNDELNKFIKNYIRRLEIKTLSSPIKGSSSWYELVSSNVVFEKSFSYFKDFFSYIIPSPDIKDINRDKLYLANISPDLFLYGLRTKTFQDSFIGTIDSYRNEDRISTLRAEMYRILNKEPMKILKATIVGNSNYYPSYTTLIVLEEFSPLKGYITQKTLKQLAEFDLKQNYRTIIAVNEIVDNPKFQKLYPSLLPKIPGYNPPTNINSSVVEKYLLKSIEYILSRSTIKHFPAELYIPLFGVYENPQPKTLIGDFIESIFEYLDLQFPDKAQQKHSAIYENLLNLSISYGGFLLEGFEYLKPQNYLVAQGQIESVSHSFSVEGSFDTNLNITYLLPAIYTYLPYKGKKLILGYVVLESPMYLYNDIGNKNNILNIESSLNKKNFYEFTVRAVEEAKKHYKEIFSDNLINLKLLEILLK
jgi:hypothetical protein